MTHMSAQKSIPDALRVVAKQRSHDVVQRLEAAMEAMEREIAQNDGVYPQNRGRVNQVEVCRRAGVSKITLQGTAHKLTTKVIVDSWVALRKVKRIPEVKRVQAERAEEWKAEHTKIGDQYALAMLELTEAENRIRELEKENSTLRERLISLSGTNVFCLRQP